MKKTLRLIALSLVLVMMVATLASCGGPSGKYSRTDKILLADVESYWDFIDDDQVKFSVSGITATGTYEIEGDQIKVTYTVGGIQGTLTHSYKLDGDVLTINNIEYTKAD
jgi:hypothetical protein